MEATIVYWGYRIPVAKAGFEFLATQDAAMAYKTKR